MAKQTWNPNHRQVERCPGSMKHYLRYFQYVVRHKWYVFLECYKLGVPWLGLIHDWSKFTPTEFGPYARSFYNPDGSLRKVWDESGYYDPVRISAEFGVAWLHHQKANKHHWQYWVLIEDEGGDKILSMPSRYRKEMLADWHGAGRAITGKKDTVNWYKKNKRKIQLHPNTQAWIEHELGLS